MSASTASTARHGRRHVQGSPPAWLQERPWRKPLDCLTSCCAAGTHSHSRLLLARFSTAWTRRKVVANGLPLPTTPLLQAQPLVCQYRTQQQTAADRPPPPPPFHSHWLVARPTRSTAVPPPRQVTAATKACCATPPQEMPCCVLRGPLLQASDARRMQGRAWEPPLRPGSGCPATRVHRRARRRLEPLLGVRTLVPAAAWGATPDSTGCS